VWWRNSVEWSVRAAHRRRCRTPSPSHVAHRVAPEAPVAHVVDRIRELNQLDSTSLDAGQTLIAPVG
jgi:hypothetical protein